MSVINTNITSMIGQQNLNKSQSALQTSMERLSSGLRINSAKDDAAGQAIANRMSSQITGLSQAQRNANDGISVAQTAEGALNQVNDNLQRIRELTVQSQNGTNSAEDKESIQAEITQRLSEIDRISKETSFNGTKVLADTKSLSIQVGANDGEAISINLKEITSATLELDDFQVTAGVDLNNYDTATDLATGAATGRVGEEFSFSFDVDSTGPGTQTAVGLYATEEGGYVVKADNGSYYDATITDGDNDTLGTIAWSSATASTNTPDTTNGEVKTLRAEETLNVDALNASDQLYASSDESGAPTKYIIMSTDADGNSVYSAAKIDEQGNVTKGAQLQVGTDGVTLNPLEKLDAAIGQVDTLRSDLGAIQNRFDSAITNLSTTETNLSAARSRIEDADYAVEVANMTRAQILQQAGTSVLAQANQIPQNVLSLLG